MPPFRVSVTRRDGGTHHLASDTSTLDMPETFGIHHVRCVPPPLRSDASCSISSVGWSPGKLKAAGNYLGDNSECPLTANPRLIGQRAGASVSFANHGGIPLRKHG